MEAYYLPRPLYSFNYLVPCQYHNLITSTEDSDQKKLFKTSQPQSPAKSTFVPPTNRLVVICTVGKFSPIVAEAIHGLQIIEQLESVDLVPCFALHNLTLSHVYSVSI